jgi:hypothetical protein
MPHQNSTPENSLAELQILQKTLELIDEKITGYEVYYLGQPARKHQGLRDRLAYLQEKTNQFTSPPSNGSVNP